MITIIWPTLTLIIGGLAGALIMWRRTTPHHLWTEPAFLNATPTLQGGASLEFIGRHGFMLYLTLADADLPIITARLIELDKRRNKPPVH